MTAIGILLSGILFIGILFISVSYLYHTQYLLKKAYPMTAMGILFSAPTIEYVEPDTGVVQSVKMQ